MGLRGMGPHLGMQVPVAPPLGPPGTGLLHHGPPPHHLQRRPLLLQVRTYLYTTFTPSSYRCPVILLKPGTDCANWVLGNDYCNLSCSVDAFSSPALARFDPLGAIQLNVGNRREHKGARTWFVDVDTVVSSLYVPAYL